MNACVQSSPLAALSLYALAAFPAHLEAQIPVYEAPPGRYAAPATFVITTNSEEAKAAFDAGYDAMLANDWTRSVAEFQRAYTLDPGLQLARAYELNLLRRSPSLAPEIDRFWRLSRSTNLIEGLLFMSIRERQLGRTFQANLLLEAAARAAPEDARLIAEHHLWFGAGTDTRVGVARTLRDRDPSSYRNHAYVANAIVSPADTVEGLLAMREALRLGADEPFAHYAAGELLTRLRRHDEAIEHYDRALDLNPRYYQATWGRAQNLLYAGRYADARADLETLAEHTVYIPSQAIARRGAALTWLHEGDIERAQRAMEQTIGEFEQEGIWRTQLAEAHSALALMAAVLGDRAGIERHNQAQVQYRGQDSGLLRTLHAFTWAIAEEAERARSQLSEAERMIEAGDYLPGASWLANVKAAVLVAEEKPAEALDVLGDADNEWALFIGFRALDALGRDEAARQRLDRLLNANDYGFTTISVPLARYLYGRDRIPTGR